MTDLELRFGSIAELLFEEWEPNLGDEWAVRRTESGRRERKTLASDWVVEDSGLGIHADLVDQIAHSQKGSHVHLSVLVWLRVGLDHGALDQALSVRDDGKVNLESCKAN